MLTPEQKNQYIDARLNEYEIKLFQLQMDRVAFTAAGDHEQVKSIEKRAEALEKAKEAVKAMKE